MNEELLLLIKRHAHTLIERNKNHPQETLEFKMNKQMQTFSFNRAINHSEEGKCLLAVTSFEATNSVSDITDKNSSFSINITGHWETKSGGKTSDELKKLVELRSQKGIEIHLKGFRKKGIKQE